jgi:hypothetical protein
MLATARIPTVTGRIFKQGTQAREGTTSTAKMPATTGSTPKCHGSATLLSTMVQKSEILLPGGAEEV